MSTGVATTFNELAQLLAKIPVIGHVHPLIPLCLPPGTQVVNDIQGFGYEIDSPELHAARPTLLIRHDKALMARFPLVNVLNHPPIEAVNNNIAHNVRYAREHLLTHDKIAPHIERDVHASPPDVVVLFLVDGLSYADVLNWCWDELQPCFVDGPSVTFRFHNGRLVETVGFASIINRPSVYERLYGLGYHQARGYTYWDRNENQIADFMFEAIPVEGITNFEVALQWLKDEKSLRNCYIQIVREGLDGLAHGKRELRPSEVDIAVKAILQDIERLLNLLESKHLSVNLYLTADHGVLWKNEHSFRTLRGIRDSKPRFTSSCPAEEFREYTVRFENSYVPYYLYTYPYLGVPIRTNDSGVHGGLSYQESIVPFGKFKV
ncbi:MAG: PglZ domain-containing protein [Chloroflexi bacterium]|nr:PglZ domain-containing protein [Chloroflexota bacterium]